MESNLKKIETIFLCNKKIDDLSKDEIIYREEFLTKFQQKFDFSLLDLNNLNAIEEKENIINVSSFNKNNLKFIFLENLGIENNISIKYDDSIEKIIRKNKGISFIILSKKNNKEYIIINSKDYFDLFVKSENNIKMLVSDFKHMPILKKIRNLLFK